MPEFNPTLVPSSSKLPAISIAAAVLLAVAGAIFYFSPSKPADITVTNVQVYAAHVEMKAMKGGGPHIIGTVPHVDNDLYIILTVKVADKIRFPLFIKDETAVLTAPDHSILESSATQKGDLANIYTAFPDLKAISSAPLARDTKVEAGQSAEGMVLLHFPGATEANWHPRESATLTLDFFHQPSQTVTIPNQK
jgi:hypothetical protein